MGWGKFRKKKSCRYGLGSKKEKILKPVLHFLFITDLDCIRWSLKPNKGSHRLVTDLVFFITK
jgi:hypothetical protein